MASLPTYDPGSGSGGSAAQLDRLYSEKAGTPLLVAGHPGPVRARLDVEAVHDRGRADPRLRHDTMLPCSSSVPGRQPRLPQPRVGPSATSASPRRSRSRATPSSSASATDYWQQYGTDVADVNAKDPLVAEAEAFGFGSKTGIDMPGRGPGPDRRPELEARLLQLQKDYYCGIAAKPQDRRASATSSTSSRASSASRATPTTPATPPTSRSARATRSSPRCSSRAAMPRSPTAARSTPRASARPSWPPTATVVRKISPKVTGHVDIPPSVQGYIDEALKGVSRVGTMAWKMGGFPLDEVADPRPRPAPPRSTASSRPAGSRPTPTTTSS